jgi:diaminopimelate decarboxylase
MDHFGYRGNQLYAEDIPIIDIVNQWGTPCYVYSRATLERHWNAFDLAFGSQRHLICYAVKANSNIAILNLFARLGSGFDIVSQGELERVLVAGGQPKKIIFSGVGKLVPEIERALEVGIGCFNVESWPELLRLNDIAGRLNKKAPISVRVNPDINANTHPYIATGLKENKFGIDFNEALSFYEQAFLLPHIEIVGIGYHIGSQLTRIQPFIDAFERVSSLICQLRRQGRVIKHLDIGGGLGVRYNTETPPSPQEYIANLMGKLKEDIDVIVEPGRAIAANAGILVTRVEYIKKTASKNFAIVDAAMNDLLRPSLYHAYQEVIPLSLRSIEPSLLDIVGPICETGDFLAKDRLLAIQEQDLLAIRTAGAYGFTMSSNYNSRPRVAEILVDKAKMHLIRRRETYTDLYSHENILE